MIKLRANQLGFSALEIAIFVIVLGLIGGSGYVVYNKTQNAKPAETTKTESTPAANTLQAGTTETTANWREVVSGQGGFALRIPDGWHVTNYMRADDIRGDEVTYNAGSKAVVDSFDGEYGGDGTLRFGVWQYKLSENVSWVDGTETSQPFSTSTLTGTRYYKQYPVEDVDGIGAISGMESYVYEFKTTKTKTYVVYNIFNFNKYSKQQISGLTKSDPDQHELVEQALETLRVKE